MLFCGDTLFAGGCGRLFEGTPGQMATSLDKLSALSSDTAVYCGHEYTVSNLRFAMAVEPGNDVLRTRVQSEQAKRDRAQPTLPSTIGIERATNPFLRIDEADVKSAAETHAVFAEIRAWKNAF
jgi:hydroxyacylglutathione hydrolase